MKKKPVLPSAPFLSLIKECLPEIFPNGGYRHHLRVAACEPSVADRSDSSLAPRVISRVSP
ncbi:MAG: hypothetical protein EHM61_18455 [Acidobacteria bacterium]|nr:MAG: hypothetical protein EHM61_18455 [Acidobacteriota bacterium]